METETESERTSEKNKFIKMLSHLPVVSMTGSLRVKRLQQYVFWDRKLSTYETQSFYNIIIWHITWPFDGNSMQAKIVVMHFVFPQTLTDSHYI